MVPGHAEGLTPPELAWHHGVTHWWGKLVPGPALRAVTCTVPWLDAQKGPTLHLVKCSPVKCEFPNNFEL